MSRASNRIRIVSRQCPISFATGMQKFKSAAVFGASRIEAVWVEKLLSMLSSESHGDGCSLTARVVAYDVINDANSLTILGVKNQRPRHGITIQTPK